MEENKNVKFIEFIKEEESVSVNFLEDSVTVADILMGVTATLKIIMDQTGKDQIEVFKVLGQMIDESENNKEEKGE